MQDTTFLRHLFYRFRPHVLKENFLLKKKKKKIFNTLTQERVLFVLFSFSFFNKTRAVFTEGLALNSFNLKQQNAKHRNI